MGIMGDDRIKKVFGRSRHSLSITAISLNMAIGSYMLIGAIAR